MVVLPESCTHVTEAGKQFQPGYKTLADSVTQQVYFISGTGAEECTQRGCMLWLSVSDRT